MQYSRVNRDFNSYKRFLKLYDEMDCKDDLRTVISTLKKEISDYYKDKPLDKLIILYDFLDNEVNHEKTFYSNLFLSLMASVVSIVFTFAQEQYTNTKKAACSLIILFLSLLVLAVVENKFLKVRFFYRKQYKIYYHVILPYELDVINKEIKKRTGLE